MTTLDQHIAAGTAIEGLTLTDEQIQRYIEVVNHTGRARAKAQGEQFHDVDFAMGAAVLLFATGNNVKVPATWIINPMQDVPIFEDKEEVKA